MNLSLGRIIDSPQERDAIHIAIAPVIAGEVLHPGQPIGFKDDEITAWIIDTPIGIVDPFLTEFVKKDQKFWLLIYPNTITSLRHEWSHPAFKPLDPSPVIESRRWIECFAGRIKQSYQTLMTAAHLWVDYHEHTRMAEFFKLAKATDWELFWVHFEIVTKIPVGNKNAKVFRCGC